MDVDLSFQRSTDGNTGECVVCVIVVIVASAGGVNGLDACVVAGDVVYSGRGIDDAVAVCVVRVGHGVVGLL